MSRLGSSACNGVKEGVQLDKIVSIWEFAYVHSHAERPIWAAGKMFVFRMRSEPVRNRFIITSKRPPPSALPFDSIDFDTTSFKYGESGNMVLIVDWKLEIWELRRRCTLHNKDNLFSFERKRPYLDGGFFFNEKACEKKNMIS